jgi:hypothetical protein
MSITNGVIAGVASEANKDVITNNGTMTISGVTISQNYKTGAAIANYGNLTIDGNDTEVTTIGSTVRNDDNAPDAVLTINGGKFVQTGTYAANGTSKYNVDGRNGKVVINGGEFVSNNGVLNAGCDVTINGGTFNSEITSAATRHLAYIQGALTINGGTFESIANSSAGGECFCLNRSTAKLVINDGYFASYWSGSMNPNAVISIYASGATYEVNAGYFSNNKVAGLSYAANTDSATSAKYPYIVKKPVVATVGGQEYADLAKAVVAAAEAGAEVVLSDDAAVTEPITIPAGTEVTIDLNGNVITADNTTYAFNNLGTLTLKDSNAGAIPSSSSVMSKTGAEIAWSVSARGIYNGYDKDGNYVSTAKLIIESGNYQATGTNGGAAVFNYGILEVKGGYFKSNGGYGLNNQATGVMTIENAEINGGIYNSGGTLTIKEGTKLLQHLSGKHAIYNWAGSVTINGGEFDSLSGNELILADGNDATVTINNGTFKKTAKSWLFGAATGKNISFVINNGKFYGYVNEPEMSVDTIRPYGDPIVVKGGMYNFNPTNWLAEGYTATLNGELYEVNEYVPAASIGGEEYETIEEALEAAKEMGGDVTVNVVAGTYDSFPADKLSEGVTLECAEGTVFEGASSLNIGGATVKGATFSNDGGTAVTGTVNGDFEDCVFTGTNGQRWCYLPEEGEITYTNCVFEGSTYGVHFDSGKGAKLIFRGCEFYGFNALPGTIDVEFYNCFFGHKEGGSKYNGVNLWGNTYMENTKFDWTADGVTEYCDPCQATPTYVFNNVTVNKTGTWEPIQFSDMSQPEGVVVTIDGVVNANVATDEQLAAAIAMDVKDLNIYLAADNLNFAGSHSKAMGGASTESVTINGNGKNLYMTSTYMPAFRLQNGGGKIAISNMTIDGVMTSATTWDVYDILFYNNTEINNVTFQKAIALDGIDNGTTFALTDVTINETKGDFYAMWIVANGAKVNIDGLNITTDVAASKGRAIAIKDQYVDNVEKVTLNISDATFASAKKAAILVTSAKGADITASNLDITGVVADKVNAVWVDSDYAANYDAVTVSGCTKWLEDAVCDINGRGYLTLQAALSAAQDNDVVNLYPGTYNFGDLSIAPANVTIKGTDKAGVVINMNKSIYLSGKTVNFENLTYTAPAGLGYTEQAFAFVHHANGFNFDNCVINRLRVNVASATIKNSTFEVITNSGFDGYGLYYYGNDKSNVKVENCVFKTTGKAICVYSEHAKEYNHTVNDTKFYSSNTSTDKAAVSIHTEFGIYGTLTMNRCEATGFIANNNGLWRELNNNTKVDTKKFTKVIDGKTIEDITGGFSADVDGEIVIW